MKLNWANRLTILRILMIPLFVWLLYTSTPVIWNQTVYLSYIWAIIVFMLASITDWLDGFIARKFNMITDLGKFLDPLADKILVISALVCFINVFWIPAWAVIVIIAREFIVTGFRLAVVEKNKEAVIAADIWGKIKTAFTMVAIIAILVLHTFFDWFKFNFLNLQTWGENRCYALTVYTVCDILIYICAALTVFSGVTMIWKNRKLFTQ